MHGSGSIDVNVTVYEKDGKWHVDQTSAYRTQRRLFDGQVYIPSSKIPNYLASGFAQVAEQACHAYEEIMESGDEEEGVTLDQALELALRHHRAGDFEQATNIYEQILAFDPENAEANHLFGVMALQNTTTMTIKQSV